MPAAAFEASCSPWLGDALADLLLRPLRALEEDPEQQQLADCWPRTAAVAAAAGGGGSALYCELAAH